MIKEVPNTIRVICPYCGRRAKLIWGNTLPLEEAREDSFYRKYGVKVWRCPNCAAMTIAGKYDNKPLGNLANAKLRHSRYELHILFDKLWKSHSISRTQAYSLLAVKMGIRKRDCHFSLFNEKQCALAKEKIIEMLKYRGFY